MKPKGSPTGADSLSIAQRADQICLQFEAALRAGESADLEDYLDKAPPAERPLLLGHLVMLHWDYARQAGRTVDLDSVLERFPDQETLLRRIWRHADSLLQTFGAAADSDAIRKCPICDTPFPVGLPDNNETLVCADCRTGMSVSRRPQAAGESPQAFSSPAASVGRFQIVKLLGAGGFGKVYLAQDPKLNRLAAVKISHGQAWGDSQEKERFLREARNAARLNHPRIVQVHDVGEADGVSFIVSEYVSGQSLAERLQRGRLDLKAAATLVAEIGEALDYAHRQLVVHRDIKPANILLDDGGQPHVADFGLARNIELDATLTEHGQVLGTPAYMPPEQAAGLTDRVNAKADIYSLGIVLYQLLTGELPFTGSARMVLDQVLRDEPRPPRRLNHQVPQDLQTICLKAISKAPAARFETAGAMSDELRRWLRGEPILSRPITRFQRGVRWARRNPLPSLLGSLAASLLLVAAGVSLTAFLIERQRRLESDRHGVAESMLRRNVENALGAAESELYFHAIQAAHIHRVGGRYRQAQFELARCPPRLRRWEWRYLERSAGRLVSHRPAATSRTKATLTASRDGSLVALPIGADQIGLFETADGRQRSVIPIPRLAICDGLAIHPKLHQIAVTSAAVSQASPGKTQQRETRVVSLSGDVLFRALDEVDIDDALVIGGIEYSPDGRRLAVAVGESVHIRNVEADFSLERTLRGHQGRVTGVAFGSNQRLATSSWDKAAIVWNVDDGSPIRVLQGHQAPVTGIAMLDSGSEIVSGDQQGNIRFWNAEDGSVIREVQAHGGAISSIRIGPRGNRVASFGSDGYATVWDLRQRAPTQRFAAWGPGLAFNQEENRLFTHSSDSAVDEWDLEVDDLDLIDGSQGWAFGLACGQQGQVAVGSHRSVRYWKSLTEPPAAIDLGDTGELDAGSGPLVQNLSFTPDGVWLAAGHTKGLTLLRVDGPSTRRQLDRRPNVAVQTEGNRRLLAIDEGGALILWDIESAQPVRTIPLFSAPVVVHAAAIDSITRRVAVAEPSGNILVCDADTGLIRHRLIGHRERVVNLDLKGSLVAALDSQGRVRIWNAETGGSLSAFSVTSQKDVSQDRLLHRALRFSQHAERLVSCGPHGDLQIWEPRTGREILTLPHRHRTYGAVEFSVDGQRLFVASNHDGLWRWEAR